MIRELQSNMQVRQPTVCRAGQVWLRPNVGEPSAPSSVDQSRISHLLNTHCYQLTNASCTAAQGITRLLVGKHCSRRRRRIPPMAVRYGGLVLGTSMKVAVVRIRTRSSASTTEHSVLTTCGRRAPRSALAEERAALWAPVVTDVNIGRDREMGTEVVGALETGGGSSIRQGRQHPAVDAALGGSTQILVSGIERTATPGSTCAKLI